MERAGAAPCGFATPHASQEPPEHIVVAESGISALSAWELLPAAYQAGTGIVSTAGGISHAGREKLEAVLLKMVAHHGAGVPILVDATDVGEKSTEARTAWLTALAERLGVQYQRAVPQTEGLTDWNEELQAGKANGWQPQEATQQPQDAAEAQPSTVEAPEAALDAPEDPQEVRRGRGR